MSDELTSDDVKFVRKLVRYECRYHPWDVPEVTSRVLEDLWRYPRMTENHTVAQAARRLVPLRSIDVMRVQQNELSADPEFLDGEEVTRLWEVAEQVTPEEELVRSETWTELVGSVASCVSVRAAASVELMFRGGMTLRQSASVLNVAFKTVDRDWQAARNHLKTVIPTPLPIGQRKPLKAGAWGTVRGVVYRQNDTET